MRKALYIFIISIGLLQIVGYVTGLRALRGVGLALCSAPLPIVFTEVRGVETFASDFFIQFEDSLGNEHSLPITPKMYSRLEGPYNRRNIYGAAISYGPVLPDSIWKAVLNYGVCKGTLVQELGIDPSAQNTSIRVVSKTKGKETAWLLQTNCSE